jgi:hypothetical protein
MKMRSLLAAVGMILAAFAVTAIGSEEATPEADAMARLFQPVPGKAVIYLIRDFGDLWVGEVKVSLDGRDMGITNRNTYMRWEIDPGEHTLVSFTSPPAALAIRTEPGGMYYIWLDITDGFQRAPSALRVVDLTTTRATVATARLLKSPQ